MGQQTEHLEGTGREKDSLAPWSATRNGYKSTLQRWSLTDIPNNDSLRDAQGQGLAGVHGAI